jgi:hypothetical protein
MFSGNCKDNVNNGVLTGHPLGRQPDKTSSGFLNGWSKGILFFTVEQENEKRNCFRGPRTIIPLLNHVFSSAPQSITIGGNGTGYWAI